MRMGRLVKVGTPLAMMAEKDEFIRSFIGRKAVVSLMDAVAAIQVTDRSVPVVRAGERLPDAPGWEFAVLVDDGDLFRGVVHRGLPAGSATDPSPAVPCPDALSPDTSILQAVERMLEAGHAWLPVLDGGRFLGLVTFKACMAFLHNRPGGVAS